MSEVHSSLDSVLAHGQRRTADSNSDDLHVSLSALGAPQHTSSGTNSCDGDLSRLKLHSLLDSYLESSTNKPKEPKTTHKVKFKAPVPKFPKPAAPPKLSQSAPPVVRSPLLSSQLYQSTTAKLGPHQWEACPRRSPKRQRSLSSPSSPARRVKPSNFENIRPQSADFDDLLALSDLDDSEIIMEPRPPFVVRHIDPHLMGRRNFCGCSHTKSIDGVSAMSKTNSSGPKPSFLSKDEVLEDLELERSLPAYLNESLQTNGEDHVPADHNGTVCRLLTSVPSCSKKFPLLRNFETQRGTTSRDEQIPSYCSPSKMELMSKYLSCGVSAVHKDVCRPGNVRVGVENPGRSIEERIERLKAECCSCKVGPVFAVQQNDGW